MDGQPRPAAEILRVESGRPRFGREMTTATIPQEAGIDERAVSFTKGCYIGQETVARLHYKGKPNRHLRGLRLEAPGRARATPIRSATATWARSERPCVSPAHGPIALAVDPPRGRSRERGSTVGEGGIGAEVVEPALLSVAAAAPNCARARLRLALRRWYEGSGGEPPGADDGRARGRSASRRGRSRSPAAGSSDFTNDPRPPPRSRSARRSTPDQVAGLAGQVRRRPRQLHGRQPLGVAGSPSALSGPEGRASTSRRSSPARPATSRSTLPEGSYEASAGQLEAPSRRTLTVGPERPNSRQPAAAALALRRRA